MDRWLICSQWAGVWATASAQNLSGYATRLAACTHGLTDKTDIASVVTALTKQLESEVRGLEQGAVNGLNTTNADDRQQVRLYYTALWLWNRLETNRWKMAQLALRQKSRRQSVLDVDHVVAWDLWQSKIEGLPKPAQTDGQSAPEEVVGRVNELGNCMLLEKNFNISKSNRPLKAFLEQVHEFKEGKFTIEEWAQALDLKTPQVDSAATPVDQLQKLFGERTPKIRGDLEEFIRGTVARVDVPPV
jgi:5-methylcytosine-specific restriction endonuclease McrA